MPETNPECYHLSASSIAAFKACPQRFRLAYREGLRVAADTESTRMGTNWHALHEVYANTGGDYDIRMAAVVAHLNERYKEMPTGFDKTKWAIEQQILLTSFVAYQWYWSNDPLEFLASEVPFELPLCLPRSGMPLPRSKVLRVGKIDHVVKWQGAICALERKSTSRSISPDSDYWDKSKKDTQVSMYALAFQDLRNEKTLLFDGERYGNTLYDVFHKPTIKPCMLTQKETAEFLATGKYYDQEFRVTTDSLPHVNGVPAEVEQGKKGFAIRETVEMYAARLLQDIYERPDFYFQRREIVRTDREIAEFQKELVAAYNAQRSFSENETWFSNEQQCRATFPCPYIPICYGPGADAVCDGKTTPDGFKRIFVDLTVNGASVNEEE